MTVENRSIIAEEMGATGLGSPRETKDRKKIKDRLHDWGTALYVTAGSLAATEGAAHAGGALAATVPDAINPITKLHDPKLLIATAALSYGPFISSLWRTSRENNKRLDKGETPYNALSLGLRNLINRFTDNNTALHAAGHVGMAVPPVGFELYYGGLTAATVALSDAQHGVSFMVGANLAAAGYTNLQTDVSQYLRDTDVSSEGKIKKIRKVIKGVAQIKKERNVERVRSISSSIGETVLFKAKKL